MLPMLARFIAPPPCVVCCREGNVLCDNCRLALPRPPLSACFWCGQFTANGQTCDHCQPHVALDGVSVAAHYDGAVHDLIGLLKYHRQRDAGPALATLLTPLLSLKFDVVTCVPVATSRLRQRGYNQSELIAKAIAKSLSLPYRPLLRRQRNTQQVGKSRHDRLTQVEGVFVAKPSPVSALIIDDVLTTGATLNACARALKQAGATNVWGAVAARD